MVLTNLTTLLDKIHGYIFTWFYNDLLTFNTRNAKLLKIVSLIINKITHAL